MNKHERILKGKDKFKRRLKLYGIDKEEIKKDPKAYRCFRTTGTPCSCYMCSPGRYDGKPKPKYRIKYKHKSNKPEDY